MRRITIIFIFLAILTVCFPLTFSLAQQVDTDSPDRDFINWKSLVPCGHSEYDPNTRKSTVTNPCSFKDAMNMINRIINFILTVLAIPVAAIMFAYAGFLMVTSGGSSEARGKSKAIFSSAAIGLIFVATAWLIIHTILSILGFNGAWLGL